MVLKMKMIRSSGNSANSNKMKKQATMVATTTMRTTTTTTSIWRFLTFEENNSETTGI